MRAYVDMLYNSYHIDTGDTHAPRRFSMADQAANAHIGQMLYPAATPDDLEQLAKIDSAALVRLHEYNFHGYNIYYSDLIWDSAASILVGRKLPLLKDSGVAQGWDDVTDAAVQRWHDGPSREFLLIIAAERMCSAQEPEYLRNLIQRFSLSDNEFHACGQLLELLQPNSRLHQLVLQDEHLLEAALQGNYSSPQIGKALEVLFVQADAWQKCQQTMGDEWLDQLLPYDKRCEIVRTTLQQSPCIPGVQYQGYISPSEVAQFAHDKIIAIIKSADNGQYIDETGTITQIELGEQLWRPEDIHRVESLVSTLLTTADPDSSQAEAGRAWQQIIDTIKPSS